MSVHCSKLHRVAIDLSGLIGVRSRTLSSRACYSTGRQDPTKNEPSGVALAILGSIPMAACSAAAFAVPEATWMILEVQSIYSTALLATYGGINLGLRAGATGSGDDGARSSGFVTGVICGLPIVAATCSAVFLNIPGALVANSAAYGILHFAEKSKHANVPGWVQRAKSISSAVALASIGTGLYLGRESDKALEAGLTD
ncbi:hypothetical protein HDU84_005357 [Entophlyctis sp. JEL0112]|nr:hypothetical protein HDU84_005357 [Entophlyctis sp. JEL0112]